jgi:peptidoglycan/LPS O-acetylase OafA/YrhL
MAFQSPPPTARVRRLDTLRGAAVIAVVMWHVYRLTIARGMHAHAVPVVLWPFGIMRLGVDVFFVLSGLLVVQSWQATRARTSGVFRATSEFLRRRARRILPAYWLSLVVLVPLVSASLMDDPRRLLAFATLNQYVKFWLPAKVNPVTWSLTTEWHFYLLVPLVAWLLTRLGRWTVFAGCVALSVVWWLQTPLLLPSSFIFGRLDQFVIGAIVGEIAREAPEHVLARFSRARGAVPAAIACGVAIGSYHGASMGMGSQPVVDALVHPIFGVLVAVVMLRLLTEPNARARPGEATLAWFGTISFGLYLWHYPILDQGLRWTRASVPLPVAAATLIAVPVLCACSIAAAKCSYVLVEQPFLSRANRPDTPNHASTLAPWPSRRSSASRPSTASHCAARPIPIPSSRRAS